MYHNMNYRAVDKILRQNGYVIKKFGNSNHVKYVKDGDSIVIPRRGNSKDVNCMIIRRLFKEHDIRF